MSVARNYPRDYVSYKGHSARYFRWIPVEYRVLEGRTAWFVPLGRLNRSEAQKLARPIAVEHDDRLAAYKRLSAAERAEIVAAGGYERWRQNVTIGEAIGLPLARFVANEVMRVTDTDAFHAEPLDVQANVALEAIQVKREADALEAKLAAARQTEARVRGKNLPNGLMSLVDLHVAEHPTLKPKVVQKMRLYMQRLIDHVGDRAPRNLTREHVVSFRDALEARGATESSVVQHLAKINTAFNTAMSLGVVAQNPAFKVKARTRTGKHGKIEKGFTGEHVKTIFAALDGEDADFQWIVKLLAYHGNRSTEICQLKVSDVATVAGVPVLRIHDENGSVKNEFSVRDVPIHPKCRGIIAYAEQVTREHGADAWLFTSLPDSVQGRGHSFQNYANGPFLRDKCKITARRTGSRHHDQTVHSFRHTWETCAREIEMPDATALALTGRALGKGSRAKYGTVPSLKQRARWLAKIDPLQG